MGANNKSSKRIPNWIAEPLVPDELIPAPEWLVYGMLPENSLGVLYGHPGSLKTFEIIALMMCLYTGMPYCGQRTKQCIPFYIAADPDPDTPRARAQAWRIYYESVLKERFDFSKLKMFRIAVNLHSQEEVEAAATYVKTRGIKPGVIVFDTLFHSSIGADLKEPDDMLALLDRARWLMKEVGARAGIIVHHTPKDGRTMFGTQALLASVDWVWRSDATGPTSATLTCERMKSARAFAPIALTFHAVQLRMAPNSWGDEWVEQLVLDLNVQPAAKAKTKEDEDLDDMETNLECFLGNKATSAAWFDQMVKWTSQGGKQEGWSRSTFDRRLKELKKQERVTGGGAQGELYSVVHTPEAERARGGNTTEEAESGVSKTTVSQTTVNRQSIHSDGGDGGFEDRQPPSNHRQDGGDGGSRKSGGTDESQVVSSSEPDLAAEAINQINAKKKPA